MGFVLFHYMFQFFSPNITLHDIPWSGLCLLFSPFSATLSGQLNIWFPPLRFQTHSQCTLWRKWVRKKLVALIQGCPKISITKADFIFNSSTDISVKNHEKGNWDGCFFFPLAILFFTYQMYQTCFPYQPPNHNPPTQCLSLLY